MVQLTDEEREVYNYISNQHKFCAIQEVEQTIGITREQLIPILQKLETLGLLKDVQHLKEDFPVIFRS